MGCGSSLSGSESVGLGGAREFSPLPGSRVTLVLLVPVHRTHVENH